MSADEFDLAIAENERAAAVRRARRREATVAIVNPPRLAEADTAQLALPAPGRCRTWVDDRRCRHAKDAHLQVGFHAGERHRCACGCRAYTSPFEMVIVALCALAIAVPIALAIWFVLVPAVVEMLT